MITREAIAEVNRHVMVRDYICENLDRTGQHIDPHRVATLLYEFETAFKGGVEHMYNFISWMQSHGYTEHEIFPTLIHDLNGRNDHYFYPRTATY